MKTQRRIDASWEQLLRVLARRCHGRTAVVEANGRVLAEALERRGVKATRIDAPAAERNESFHTVVVAKVLERCSDAEGTAVLDAAWRLVKQGGRLVVTVPNKGCKASLPGEREFDASTLRRRLAPFGRPRLWTEQPLAWLTQYVDKPTAGASTESRSRRERFKVTAGLCRGKVLELGCGEGHLANVISGRGLEVVGVEMNAEKVRRGRELYPHLALLEGDILSVSLPEEHFDTVVIAEVLEHVPGATGDAMLTRAWGFLKPEGRLIVSVPNEDCIPHPNHVRRFDRHELRRLLRPLGQPRLVTEQPYKWLMMVVRKAPGGAS